MDFLHWCIDWIKYLMLEFPKPDNLKDLVDKIGVWWIYAALFAIVFSETGLLVGFFLPGDSLLFACGMLCGLDVLNLGILVTLLIIAAIVGDALNYALGYRMGARVYEKGNLWFIKHEHLMAAKAFYERHGGKAIILARFVPLVRTFTPFVAGVARMTYRQFVWYNVIGGVAWVLSMTLAGYFLGQFEFVKVHFEKIVLGIIFVSVLPVVIGGIKHWQAQRRAQTDKSATSPEESTP
jgi:membrane-associated protein